MNLKSLFPKSIKLKFRLIKRFLSDRNIDFAATEIRKPHFLNAITTVQEIKQGAFFENKVHNLKTASGKIETSIIYPGQVFSFWKCVGAPIQKNGFKKGRNIIKGKVSEEIGGGLCQLSSIIYVTALKANLEITERHNHSIDIYKENERFTPLGADATVVYGYKDLRFKNNTNSLLYFTFSFEENQITCELKSTSNIPEFTLDFIRNNQKGYIEVVTLINNNRAATSTYKIMEL